MNTLREIIIDDEPSSVSALYNLLERFCPEITILTTANDIEDAFIKINHLNPDIIFLDVDLAPHTGFDLLRKFSKVNFKVIFVTAYDYYAIDAIKFSALYYLLKPVRIEELKEAVERAKNELNIKNNDTNYNLYLPEDFKKIKNITLKTHQGVFIIELNDIVHLKADNSYTNFHLNNGEQILSSKPIKEYEDMLHDKGFFRSHKSHIVNIQYVASLSKTEGDQIVLKNKEKIPLSHRRKDEFAQLLHKFSF